MHKADDDDNTTRPVRTISQAPPPVRQIRPGRIPPASPPPAFVPDAPTGFVTFAVMLETLAANAAAWAIPPERLPVSTVPLETYARQISTWLQANSERAAGIFKHSGALFWAPSATWRMSSRVDGKEVSAFAAGMHGKAIRFPAKYAAFECYPIISCRALALSFGAENPPEAPPHVSGCIREIDPILPAASRPPKKPKHNGTNGSPETKRPARVPYPKLSRWWITVYLPQYPEPDKRPNVEKQRMDAAAAFPDHSPPTERTMQNLRADKGTPPEWSEVGRRPKSE